jgi:hypothetical protein
MTPPAKPRVGIWRETRPLLAPLLVVVGYVLMEAVLAHVTTARGVLGPSLHVPTLVLAIVVLVWRLVAIFVVPGWLVYRLLDIGVRRLLERSSRAPGHDARR